MFLKRMYQFYKKPTSARQIINSIYIVAWPLRQLVSTARFLVVLDLESLLLASKWVPLPQPSEMLTVTGPDLHKKSFRIKLDDKLFSRHVSKESSMANPSFRVYYGDVSGAVPFTWETRPGTPKHTFSDSTLPPPLTPPPSYCFHSTKNPSKNQPRSKLLRNLLMRINLKKAHLTALSSSSSSSSLSWSSSYSSFSGAMTPSSFHGRRRFSSWGSSSLDDREDDHLHIPSGSPKPRFCFLVRRNCSGGNQGGNPVVSMKKNILSMIGCGSG